MLQQLGYFIGCLEDGESVPVELLDQYLQVVSSSKAALGLRKSGREANPDAADMSYHCAFTFAAVVRTMGKGHWPALKACSADAFNEFIQEFIHVHYIHISFYIHSSFKFIY